MGETLSMVWWIYTNNAMKQTNAEICHLACVNQTFELGRNWNWLFMHGNVMTDNVQYVSEQINI